MLNLKGPYDVVNAAEMAWKQKAAEIAALLEQGTDEATQQALALQESLEALQADYEAKKALYDKLVSANAPSDISKLFVPASPTPPDDNEKPKGVMKRPDFEVLNAVEKRKFVLSGGKVVDQ